MAQVLTVRDREQAEEWEWGVALVEEGWVEIVLEQAPVAIAFVPVVEQKLLIKSAFLAII
jgi:hypothetical protein